LPSEIFLLLFVARQPFCGWQVSKVDVSVSGSLILRLPEHSFAAVSVGYPTLKSEQLFLQSVMSPASGYATKILTVL
jgi:F0F1-type ATP synthase assembly protein I